MLPGHSKHEDEERNKQPDNELEVVIPDIGDETCYFLLYLVLLLSIFLVEILHHILVGKTTVELDC